MPLIRSVNTTNNFRMDKEYILVSRANTCNLVLFSCFLIYIHITDCIIIVCDVVFCYAIQRLDPEGRVANNLKTVQTTLKTSYYTRQK